MQDDRERDRGRRDDGGEAVAGLDRRELLKRAVSATVGLGALGLACGDTGEAAGSPGQAAAAAGGAAPDPAPAATDSARIRGHRVLGNTGLRVSDVGFGTGGGGDPILLQYAFDRGVTWFDTAESYPLGHPGVAEKAIGRAFRGRRDQIVLTTKTEAQATDTRQVLMQRLNNSLRRLQTDHVDIYFNHAVNDLARLENPEWFEFAAQAKQQGKLRFTGMSGHAGRLVECLDAAIDRSLVDAILVAFNFGEDPAFYEKITEGLDLVARQPELPRVIAKAKQKGIGVLAMKTLRGGRLNDLRAHERPDGTFAQAALRWALANPSLDALVISMGDRAQVDEYLGASGATALLGGDLLLLREYARRNDPRYCRPACDACTGSCPHGVPISDVLRSRMYAEDYGDLARAQGAYASLGAGASPCLTCSGAPCRGACPHGLDISSLTRHSLRVLGRA
jgi:aryl-alcohol dehydrogenase-like predicted oxidoreductase